MITAVLVISILNLALQLVAVWQRHVSIREQRKSGEGVV
jgi:hypothetical protein